MRPPRWQRGIALALWLLSGAKPLLGQSGNNVITDDLIRFWQAYDRINATADTGEQRALLHSIYLNPGTPGLAAMIRARRYTPDEYLTIIRSYPKFWQSIRPNTLRAPQLASAIADGAERLRTIYPALRPPTVYFTVGAFRSGGTTLDGLVLVGSEFALGDSTVDLSEFPPHLAQFASYFAGNPINNVVDLNVHEMVHTQQRDHPYRLLERALYEGIAEYAAVTAMGKPSSSPAIEYGRHHQPRISDRFGAVLMSSYAIDDWFYNDTNNEFGVRDLGYYVGYEIAERHLRQATDKPKAFAELIDLDYADTVAVAKLVDGTRFFRKPVRGLIRAYEASRPTVTAIRGLRNGAVGVAPGVVRLTIEFSAPMLAPHVGFDVGPLGDGNVLRVRSVLGFAPDGRSASVEVELQPHMRQQLLLGERFRTASGLPLTPYLVDITTK